MGWFSSDKLKVPEVVPVTRVVNLNLADYMQQALDEAISKLPEHEKKYFEGTVNCHLFNNRGQLAIKIVSDTHTEVR